MENRIVVAVAVTRIRKGEPVIINWGDRTAAPVRYEQPSVSDKTLTALEKATKRAD